GTTLSRRVAPLSRPGAPARLGAPPALPPAPIRSALSPAAGETAAALIPPHVAAIAAGVTPDMFLKKAKIATVVTLALGVLAAGLGLTAYQALAARQPATATATPGAVNKPQPATKAGAEQGPVTYSVR